MTRSWLWLPYCACGYSSARPDIIPERSTRRIPSQLMIKKANVLSAALLAAASLPWQANASTFDFTFTGPGVSGSIQLTYGSATDAKYPQAFEVTGISGTFSDSNNGLNLVNVPIGPLVPITRDTPEPGNLLAPHDFSRFAVATGLSPQSNGFLTYDNLFYPGGSPPTASDDTIHGGILDIDGLMFEIGGGTEVDLWSNGDFNRYRLRSDRLRRWSRDFRYSIGLCERRRNCKSGTRHGNSIRRRVAGFGGLAARCDSKSAPIVV